MEKTGLFLCTGCEIGAYGLPPTPFVESFPDFAAAAKHCEELIERLHELEFEVDGLVLVAADTGIGEAVGEDLVARHDVRDDVLAEVAARSFVGGIAAQLIGEYGDLEAVLAARGGYEKIVVYWGILETAQENLETKAVSWVPIVGVGMKARLCGPTGRPQLLTIFSTCPGSISSMLLETSVARRPDTSMRVPSGARMCI